eukprot:gene543-721_t
MAQASPPTANAAPDVVLIGAGIMSATLGTMLKELEPSLSIAIYEVLADCAQESSGAWNNAGTGHAANCELNYTPQRPDGSVDISKALEVNTEFDLSRQLWSYLVRKGAIPDPRASSCEGSTTYQPRRALTVTMPRVDSRVSASRTMVRLQSN